MTGEKGLKLEGCLSPFMLIDSSAVAIGHFPADDGDEIYGCPGSRDSKQEYAEPRELNDGQYQTECAHGEK